MKEVVPVAKGVPPEAAAYQSIVSPAPGVAEIVAVPVPQMLDGPATGTAGREFIVAVTGTRAE